MNGKITAVVAQANIDNMEKVCEFLTRFGYTILGKSESGAVAADLIISNKPDVVIADAYMFDIDICGMIDKVGDSAKPIYVMATAIGSGCVIENVLSHGVDIVTLIPFDGIYLDKKIRDRLSSEKEHTAGEDKFELMNYVSRMMHEVGIPASISGYHYIRESIMMSLSDRRILKSITKELYPTVAKNNDTTPSRVERAIRHAVEVAWQRGDVETLNAIFGYTVKSTKGKPTNGEFISMLTERVRLDLKIS